VTVTPSTCEALIRKPRLSEAPASFYDITTLLKQLPDAFREVIDRMRRAWEQVGDKVIDLVVGMESRGFIFQRPAGMCSAGLRRSCSCAWRAFRRRRSRSSTVSSAAGTATLEIHSMISPGSGADRVDDLLATAGRSWARDRARATAGGEIAPPFMVG
jgi:adenine/guanine phosphoribosyltransferase-like PRPP-binding protein